jgi:hypothetical protein
MPAEAPVIRAAELAAGFGRLIAPVAYPPT